MSAVELIKDLPVSLDRTGWARRGHVEFHPDQVLSLEVPNTAAAGPHALNNAAQQLDDWAIAAGGEVTELQHVFRRGKRVLYGRVTKS